MKLNCAICNVGSILLEKRDLMMTYEPYNNKKSLYIKRIHRNLTYE